MLSGDNSILQRAINARDNTNISQIKEEQILNNQSDIIDNITLDLPDPSIVESNGIWLMDKDDESSYFKYEGVYYLIVYNQENGTYESIRRTTGLETDELERLFNIEEGDWLFGWVYKNDNWCAPYFNDKLLGNELNWYYNNDYRRRRLSIR